MVMEKRKVIPMSLFFIVCTVCLCVCGNLEENVLFSCCLRDDREKPLFRLWGSDYSCICFTLLFVFHNQWRVFVSSKGRNTESAAVMHIFLLLPGEFCVCPRITCGHCVFVLALILMS